MLSVLLYAFSLGGLNIKYFILDKDSRRVEIDWNK